MIIKRAGRILLYVVLSIILLVLILQLVINFYINNKLAGDLQQQVKESTHGKYSLDLKRASVSLFSSTIKLEDITFRPNKCDSCVTVRYKLEAKSIALSGIGVFHYLTSRCMSARSLGCEDLIISIYQGKHAVQKDSAAARLSIYKILSKDLRELDIKEINISGSKLKIFPAGGDSTALLNSDDCNINIENFLFNKEIDDEGRLFLADKLVFKLNSFSYRLPGGLYKLNGKGFTASFRDSVFSVDSLNLVSNYRKQSINAAAGHQASWIKLILCGIEFSRMEISSLLDENALISKKLTIDRMFLETYRDKNAEFKHHVKPSVQKIIRNIPFYVKIDTIDVKASDIFCSVVASGSEHPGKISFNRLKGAITNVTNDSAAVAGKQELKMKVSGFLLNKGKFSVLFVFPLNTPKVVFDCSGRLQKMELKEMNSLIENGKGVSIKTGQLDTMAFSFHANEKESVGTMRFLYHGLTIELLDRNSKTQNLKDKVLSFVLDKFVVDDANPKDGKAVRITPIHYEFYPYKSFFYYTQKSLESGMLPAIGIKNADKMLKETDNK